MLGHPWHAQFNIDLGSHLLLIVAWLIGRGQNLVIGFATALLAVLFSGSFTFAYLTYLVRAMRGDVRALLLDRHHLAPGANS